MFDVFGSVKGLIKLDSVCIDNKVFRLHYKATFVILVVASLLVTSKQYIGDPIDCIVEEIPNNVRPNFRFDFSNKKVHLKLLSDSFIVGKGATVMHVLAGRLIWHKAPYLLSLAPAIFIQSRFEAIFSLNN